VNPKYSSVMYGRLDVGPHRCRRGSDEADRHDPLDEPLLVDRLHVLEQHALAPFEQPTLGEERLPVALLPARGIAFERVDDLGEGRLQRVALVAGIPDEREPSTWTKDAMDLA
jgi:hypothetical protein